MLTPRPRGFHPLGELVGADELVAESTREDPRFPEMVEAAYEQRLLGEQLAARRRGLSLSQRAAAERMRSTQRIVNKIEHGGDVNVSTLRRYAHVLGLTLHVTTTGSKRSRAA